MKLIINIDGKDIAFASNGATLLLYRKEFKKDFLKEVMSVTKSMSLKGEDTKEDENEEVNKNNVDVDIDTFDFELIDTINEFAYICAKTANKNIDDFEKWLEEFDDPTVLLSHSQEIMKLIGNGFATTVEPKDKKKQKGKS